MERVGVRRIKIRKNAFKFPLILTFSLKGEGAKPLILMAGALGRGKTLFDSAC
jgi:hypothetical protein